jgi:GH25 family lysozyme M1 (1,4-beta-N-acetylmuramidase)
MKTPVPAGCPVGIDVSHWQGVIDWTQVKKAGVKFAIIRTGDGVDPDSRCPANIGGAIDAGIPFGLYHYVRARRTVLEHLSTIQEAAPARLRCDASLPFSLDYEDGTHLPHEDTAGDMPVVQVLPVLTELRETVRGLTGRDPWLYTGQTYHWRVAQLGAISSLQTMGLWTPSYVARNTLRKNGDGLLVPAPVSRPRLPVHRQTKLSGPTTGDFVWQKPVCWQYTSKGIVPGISGLVDMNLLLEPELLR